MSVRICVYGDESVKQCAGRNTMRCLSKQIPFEDQAIPGSKQWSDYFLPFHSIASGTQLVAG